MLKWFLNYVLPGLVIALVLYLTPLFLGVFSRGILIASLGGVPRSEYDKLEARVKALENRTDPPLPKDVIRSDDKISLKATVQNRSGESKMSGYISLAPTPAESEKDFSIKLVPVPYNSETFEVQKIQLP
jgi:hypothetical protein